MRDSSYRFALAMAVLGAVYLFTPAPASAQLSSEQAAGKRLYLQGENPSGSRFEAILSDGDTRVPAHLMPCGSCHGADGRGRAEGGVIPSDVTWEVLSHSSRTNSTFTPRRRAYDATSLRHAIIDGVDPDGNRLGLAMPRYLISPGDLNNLIAYLKILGNEPERGITDDRIRIGAVVPANSLSTTNESNFAALLQAYFEELNQHGGIYNRKLELVTLQTVGTGADVARALKRFVKEENIFALLAPLAPGGDSPGSTPLQQLEVPAVITYASGAAMNDSEESQVFFVFSGLFQESDSLVKVASDHHQAQDGPPAIVFPEQMQLLADYTANRCRAMSLGDIPSFKYVQFDPKSVAGWLKRQNLRTVFFLGNGRELRELLENEDNLTIFQPGPLAGQEFFASAPQLAERVFLSFPILPSDVAPEALADFHLLLRKHSLSQLRPAPSLLDLASAKVLTEALRQSGRQLTRAKLVNALRNLRDFDTGLAPLVSYGPERRIGTSQACVVKWNGERKVFSLVDRSLTLQ